MTNTERLAEALRWWTDDDDVVDFGEWVDEGIQIARAALAAFDAQQAAAQAVPAGFKWVPVEPTEDMLFAAELSKPRGYRDLWAAMLAAAAPAPQAQAAGQDERAAFGAWFQGYRHGWKSEKDVTFDAWQARAALAQRPPLTDEQIRREKPVCADFVSFRAGVRCAERMHEVSK